MALFDEKGVLGENGEQGLSEVIPFVPQERGNLIDALSHQIEKFGAFIFCGYFNPFWRISIKIKEFQSEGF